MAPSKSRKMSKEEKLQYMTKVILEIKDEKTAKKLAENILDLLDKI